MEKTTVKQILCSWGSSIAQWLAYLLLDPAGRVHFSAEGKIVHVAEVNQWRCLVVRGEWLKNADQDLLELARDKLELKKLWGATSTRWQQQS